MDINEKEKQKDYYKILMPDVPIKNLDNFLSIGEKYSSPITRKKYALDIPDVDASDNDAKASETPAEVAKTTDPLASTPLDIPNVDNDLGGGIPATTPSEPQEDNIDKETLSVLLDIEDIKHSLSELKTELKINDTKEEIRYEVDQMIKSVKKELDDLKARKIPVRKEYDSDSAYKEQLYPQIVNIMDDLLVPLIDSIPEYSLLATQISSTYDDGTIKNAIVAITVSIINNDYKYDFKVDVPILNGLIQSPQYMTRGRKIIPMTQEALYTELNTESFIKISPDYRSKNNMFSNIGENIGRQHDTQKAYPTNPTEQHSMIEGDKKWVPNRQRGLINEE